MADILILNGSPRKNGNTEGLVDAFIEGATQKGHTTHKINLQMLNINPCLGCLKCLEKKGDPCVQKDGMKQVYSLYDKADMVVFASPMYFWSFTAQLKAALDRLFASAAANDMQIAQKNCAMIIAAEEESKENFAPVLSYYDTLVKWLKWNDKGRVLAGGLFYLGDIKGSAYLEEARKLGESV